LCGREEATMSEAKIRENRFGELLAALIDT
jgi:hypothetical protein